MADGTSTYTAASFGPTPTPTRWSESHTADYDILDLHGGDYCLGPLQECRHVWAGRSFLGLASDMETGKGVLAESLFSGRRGVLVEPSMGLLPQMTARVGGVVRRPWDEADRRAHLDEAASVSILGMSLGTLPRLAKAGRDLRDDLCVFDEICTTHDFAARGGERTQRLDVVRATAHVMGTGGQVWLMDAFLDEAEFRCSIALARVGGRRFGPGDRPLLIRYHSPQKPRGRVTLFQYGSALREAATQEMSGDAGPRGYITDARTDLEALEEIHRAEGRSFLTVTGRTRLRPDQAEWLRDPTPERAARVGLSPAAMVGLNVKAGWGGHATYPRVYINITHPQAVLRLAQQSLARFRGGPDLAVCFRMPRGERPVAVTTDAIRLADLATEGLSAARLGTSAQAFGLLDHFVGARRAEQSRRYAEFCSRPLPETFARMGFAVSDVVREGASKPWNARWTVARADADRRAVREVLGEVPELLGEDGLVCEADRRTMMKVTGAVFGLAALALPENDALARADYESCHKHPEKIQTIRLFHAPRQQARDIDMRERGTIAGEAVPALADRTNVSLRLQLLDDLLAEMGIDARHFRDGGTFQVAASALGWWRLWAESNASRLWQQLGVKAPVSLKGAVATLKHALSWIGLVEVEAHHRRRGGAQEWVRVVALSELAARRGVLGDAEVATVADPSPEPIPAPGTSPGAMPLCEEPAPLIALAGLPDLAGHLPDTVRHLPIGSRIVNRREVRGEDRRVNGRAQRGVRISQLQAGVRAFLGAEAGRVLVIGGYPGIIAGITAALIQHPMIADVNTGDPTTAALGVRGRLLAVWHKLSAVRCPVTGSLVGGPDEETVAHRIWAGIEARIIDDVLTAVRGGVIGRDVRVCQPLPGGVLIDCPRRRVAAVEAALMKLLAKTAKDVLHVDLKVAVGSGATWGEAERQAGAIRRSGRGAGRASDVE